MHPRPGPLRRVEAAIGWTALLAVLLSALPQGGVVPVVWLALALLAFALLGLQLVVDLLGRRGTAVVPALRLPALLALGAMGWGLVQVSPAPGEALAAVARGLAPLVGQPPPDTLAFPAWGTVDVPGTISADPVEGRQGAVRLAAYLALFVLAVRAGADAARAAAMLRTAAVWVAALAAFGLYTAARGENVLVADVGTGLVSAPFVNRNSFATYAAFGVVTSLAILLAGGRARRPSAAGRGTRRRALRDTLERLLGGGWIALLSVVVSTTALVASQSRGGAVAAACGVAAVVIAARRGGRAGPLVRAVLAVAAVALLVGAGGLFGRGADIAAGQRLPVYGAILRAIGERPLLGYGLGAFQDAFRAFVPREAGAAGEWDLAHNTFLQLAFELGVPAAAALLLALLLVAGRVAGAALRGGALLPVAAFGCVVVAAVHSTVDFSLQIPAVAALFATLLGLAVPASVPSPGRAPVPPAPAATVPAAAAEALPEPSGDPIPPRLGRRR